MMAAGQRGGRAAFPKSAGPGRPQAGFTLVELMIALTLGLLVVGAAIAVLLSNRQSYTTNNSLSQVQDNSRIAYELLARDIRETGLTGCGDPGRIANVLKDGPNNSGTDWYANIGNAVHGYDGSATDPAVQTGGSALQRVSGTSSIQLVAADGAGVSVASNDSTNAKISLNESSSNLVAGDIVVLCDPDHAVILQTTSYTGTGTLSFNYAASTGTPGNCSTGLGYPTVCTSGGNPYAYQPNAMVAKLYVADWFLGYNKLGGKSLFRNALVNVGGVPTPTVQEMVRNVVDLQISYHTTGGASFGNAASVADWSTVDAVTLGLTLQGTSQNAGTDLKPLARTVTTTVTLRNRV
jgi:type IV pilus assembly protein PilW